MRPRIPVEILKIQGRGGSYMSVALYCTLRQWGGVNQKLSARGKGALHAANPTHCNIPPMRVLGSARIPIVFLPEDCVHNIAVRILEGLPYGFILGARFFYANKSILNFGTDKGFKPTPASPWVPFLDKNMTASNSPSRKRAQPLPREDALKLFPIGTTVAKESDSEIIRGQVYDYRAPYWRVQYENNDWEELSRQEVHRMAGAHQDDT